MARPPKMDSFTAQDILYGCRAYGKQFHALNNDAVERLLESADLHKYRKPRNANGSRGRYWHAYLERAVARGE